MTQPVDRMTDAAVRCTVCGTQGIGNCDCWVECSCGWFFGKGGGCGNPIHFHAENSEPTPEEQ